jgi:NAD(P)-dependent dehydrogenase (short-subunit alcohol dehydrogenase family)
MPVEIVARSGQAVKVKCKNQVILKAVQNSLGTDEWSHIVGELAFGINSKARFVDEFLEAEKIKEEGWDQVLDVNLKGVFLCCQAVGKKMIQQGGG